MKAERKEILPGVTLTCVKTDKFKTNCISINLLTQLKDETASLNALVPRVLLRGCESFPDMESIAAHLDGLYGASLDSYVRKKGEIQIIGLYADFIDEMFVPGGEGLLKAIAQLMGEVLLKPRVRGGLLLDEYVKSEKEKLIEQLKARINEKRSYSMQRLFELMCAGEDYSVDRLGSEKQAENINYARLTKRYMELINTCPIEVFYCGSGELADVEQAVMAALEKLPRGKIDDDIGTSVRMNTVDEKPRYFIEELDVTQGKLAIGFRLGDCMNEDISPRDIAAIRVMNAVFGGSVTSKLFMNVREKLSLAYFASSMVDVHKGVMAVSSGIEFLKFDEARIEIFSQLDAVKNGEITDDELCAAKKYLAAGQRVIVDSERALEDYYISQNIMGLNEQPEEFAELCEKISKQEVVKIAKGIECDAIYFLKGLEEVKA